MTSEPTQTPTHRPIGPRIDNRLLVWWCVFNVLIVVPVIGIWAATEATSRFSARAGVCAVVMLLLCGFAILRCPTVIEFGDQLVVRWLLWCHVYEWSAVTRIHVEKPGSPSKVTIEVEGMRAVTCGVSGKVGIQIRAIADSRGISKK